MTNTTNPIIRRNAYQKIKFKKEREAKFPYHFAAFKNDRRKSPRKRNDSGLSKISSQKTRESEMSTLIQWIDVNNLNVDGSPRNSVSYELDQLATASLTTSVKVETMSLTYYMHGSYQFIHTLTHTHCSSHCCCCSQHTTHSSQTIHSTHNVHNVITTHMQFNQ